MIKNFFPLGLNLFFLFSCARSIAGLGIVENEKAIVIRQGEQHVLTYHKAEMDPPEGTSPLFRRSAFIHPLTAPNGAVVTDIHTPDHTHHMGLWHAWVHAEHKGRKVDFWNLKKGQGTVRYVETQAIRRGEDRVGFSVIQHHVMLPNEIILKEVLSVDVRVSPDGAYLVDYQTVQENITDTPLKLPAYRYGGCLAYRGPPQWNQTNSAILTSAGKDRENGHETRADWCRFTGPTDAGPVAVTFLAHPTNHDAPQRQRIWPGKSNNGAVFYNFVPIQEHDWSLAPGVQHTMKYQLVLSAGTPDKAKIDGWFKAFSK
ncbi:MAG: hypothetical protein ACI9TH_004161 [Kiritimatiellia bacterium]|jgi:hypothetical protein